MSQLSFKKRLPFSTDKDTNGNVDLAEFLAAFDQVVGPSVTSVSVAPGGQGSATSARNPEARLRFAFKVYDVDGDGYISRDDLFQVLTT